MMRIVETYGTAQAGLALLLAFVVFAPNFATPGNLLNLVKDTSSLARRPGRRAPARAPA